MIWFLPKVFDGLRWTRIEQVFSIGIVDFPMVRDLKKKLAFSCSNMHV